MSIDLSPDIWNEIQRQLATGSFRSPDEVMREALAALRDREKEMSGAQDDIDDICPPNTMSVEDALREAIEDLKEGRYRPAEDVSREIDRRFNFRGE
jgi:Arc/MetJ-type ribon-helix-helix transcriptional regulator